VTVANTISILRFCPNDAAFLVQKVDSEEQKASSQKVHRRLVEVKKIVLTCVRIGLNQIEKSSLSSFLRLPFRNNFPEKLKRIPKKPKAFEEPAAPTFELFLSPLVVPSTEIKNDGLGECMFKALSTVVYGTEKHYQKVREMVVEVVGIEAEYLKAYVHTETFADHVTRLKKPGEWREHPELYAANLLFKKRFEIFQQRCSLWGLSSQFH